jgi:hypothetical protein
MWLWFLGAQPTPFAPAHRFSWMSEEIVYGSIPSIQNVDAFAA